MRTVYKVFIERSQVPGNTSKTSFHMPDQFANLYNLCVSLGELKPMNISIVAENIKHYVGFNF
jgi:hypothetical protein